MPVSVQCMELIEGIADRMRRLQKLLAHPLAEGYVTPQLIPFCNLTIAFRSLRGEESLLSAAFPIPIRLRIGIRQALRIKISKTGGIAERLLVNLPQSDDSSEIAELAASFLSFISCLQDAERLDRTNRASIA